MSIRKVAVNFRAPGAPAARARLVARRRDEGQISGLLIGLFAVAALLLLGGIDVTAAHLARVRLLDTADAAALDAADALDEETAYRRGVGRP